MPILEINGRDVEVDDSFLRMTPEQQNATVDEIAQSMGAGQSPELKGGLSELSAITQNPAKAQYDALPAWQKPIVAASDIGQLTAQGAASMVGLNPEKGAAWVRSTLGGGSYQDELAEQQRMTNAARQRAGLAGTTAEVVGGVAAPLAAANRGLTLAGRFGTGAMTGAKGLAARSALMGAEGAAYGTANAFANDQDLGEGAALGLAGGVGGNLLGEGIAAGVSKVAGRFNPKPQQITVDDLKASSNRAYARARAEGVVFNQQGINQLRTNVIQDLTARGFDPVNEPGVMPVIKRLQAMGTGNVTFEGLDTLRKVASNGYRPGMKSNNAAIGGIVNRIDELVNAADPSTVLMGRNPQAAADALSEARSMWGRARKLETVETLINKGELIGGSQKNQDIAGATKRQLRGILTNEARARGFSKAELDATRKVVLGSKTKRALDASSGMVPTGRLGGLAQGSIGAANLATGNVPGLLLQGAGMGAGWMAGKAAEALSRKSVAELTTLISRGGVPAPVVQNTLQLLAKSKREALTRALMAMGVSLSTHAARAEAPDQQGNR